MDGLEMAQEGLERAHGEGEGPDAWTRRAAVVVALLAAGAVVAEMSANDAQTHYLAAHIAASDTWTQYQAKSVRRAVYQQSADTMRVVQGDAARAQIAAAEQQAERMRNEPGHDGMQQLADRAHEYEADRDRDLHRHEGLERGVRGLQIAIVLTSLFVVTRVRWLLYLGAALGVVAAAYALAAGLHML